VLRRAARSHLDNHKLTQITYPGGGSNTFVYNGEGVRVQKTDSSGTVKFVYDGANVIGELDGAGNLITAYTHGVGGLVSLRRAAGPLYYHFDGLGSTTELTDATQAVTDSYRYEAFGNLTAQAGNTRNAYRYVGSLGYYADSDSGLMLLGARYYAPAVGRFVTVDPAKEGGNWYGYVGSNPVRFVDPTGYHSDAECIQECTVEYADDIKDCQKEFKKCKKWCIVTLPFWPACVYFICQPRLTVCLHQARVEYQQCVAWCLSEEHDATHGQIGQPGPSPPIYWYSSKDSSPLLTRHCHPRISFLGQRGCERVTFNSEYPTWGIERQFTWETEE